MPVRQRAGCGDAPPICAMQSRDHVQTSSVIDTYCLLPMQLRLMCQFINVLDVEVLQPYLPSPEERADAALYAANVRAMYASETGWPLVEQSQREFIALCKVSPHIKNRESTAGIEAYMQHAFETGWPSQREFFALCKVCRDQVKSWKGYRMVLKLRALAT